MYASPKWLIASKHISQPEAINIPIAVCIYAPQPRRELTKWSGLTMMLKSPPLLLGGSKDEWLARYKQGLALQCLNNIGLTIIQTPGVKMLSDAHS